MTSSAAAEAGRLVQLGKEACSAGRFAEGVKFLEQAYALDERHLETRGALRNGLIEAARGLIESDAAAAEPFLTSLRARLKQGARTVRE